MVDKRYRNQMESIFERLERLDAEPNWRLINKYNQHFASNQLKYQLIANNQVRPCFFTGDVESGGKVVSISLNPAYTPGATEAEHAGIDFKGWYRFCQNRFLEYERESEVHSIFKNLFKLIAPPATWNTVDKREYLQENLLNLDWCCYYSENFSSFAVMRLPQDLRKLILETFDTTLSWLIEQSKPRYIFVHGRAMQSWVDRHAEDFEHAIMLQSNNGPCRLYMGRYLNSSVRMYYLEHFINRANKNTTLKRLNQYLNNNGSP